MDLLLSTSSFAHLWDKWRRHPVIRNAFSLYIVQFAEYLLPMLTVPYLARVLGAGPWGVVIYAQSFAGWAGMLMEYGFNMSATRRLAQLGMEEGPAKQRAQGEIVAGVLGASVVLASIVLAVAALCAWKVPLFGEHPQALVLATAIALVQGMRPFWFFQGIEELAPISRLNLGGRICTTLGVFWLVKTRDDANWILWLQLISATVILLWCLGLIYRRVPFVAPDRARAFESLRHGWSLFVTRSAISLYTLANTFVLGWFVPAEKVTMFGGPERLNRAALSVLNPILGALYPRMASLAAGDPNRVARAARLGFLVVVGMGVCIGGAMALFAPAFIKILGPGYEEAIPVFRILSLLAPLIAANSMLGSQWMIPLGLDHQLNRVILAAGVLNLALAMLLAREYGPAGMAVCAVAAEAIVLVGIIATLQSTGRGFWSQPK